MESRSRVSPVSTTLRVVCTVGFALALGAGCKVWPDFDPSLLDPDGSAAPMDAARPDVTRSDGAVPDVRSDVIIPTPPGGFRACTPPNSSASARQESFVTNNARAIIMASDGTAVIAGAEIVRWETSGTTTPLSDLGIGAFGIVAVTDAASTGGTAGWLFTSNRNGPALSALDTMRTVSVLVPSTPFVAATDGETPMLRDLIAAGSNAMWIAGSAARGRVYRYTVDAMGASQLTSEITLPDGHGASALALVPDGTRMFVGSASGGIFTVPMMGGSAGVPMPFATLANARVQSLAFDECGYVYAADSDGARIVRITPDGASTVDVFRSEAVRPSGLAFGRGMRDVHTLYFTDGASGYVFSLALGVPGADVP